MVSLAEFSCAFKLVRGGLKPRLACEGFGRILVCETLERRLLCEVLGCSLLPREDVSETRGLASVLTR